MSRLLTITIATALLVGCSGSSGPCEGDGDCYATEVCVQGLCAPRASGRDAGTVRGEDMARGQDVGRMTADTGTAPDQSVVADPADVGTQEPDGSPPLEDEGPCEVDIFASCADPTETSDGNQSFGERLHQTAGCPSAGFEAVQTAKLGRICPLDPGDTYVSHVYECEEREITLEATLKLPAQCDQDAIMFEAPYFRCGVRSACDTLADGRRRIRVVLPQTEQPLLRSVQWKIDTPERDDMSFAYELTVEIR